MSVTFSGNVIYI